MTSKLLTWYMTTVALHGCLCRSGTRADHRSRTAEGVLRTTKVLPGFAHIDELYSSAAPSITAPSTSKLHADEHRSPREEYRDKFTIVMTVQM
jgi:hypothetical protein